MFKRLTKFSLIATSFGLLLPALASAHVVVTPAQANVAQELVFNISSPNEQQTPVVKVTLDIPQGVSEVTPTVKPGWTITTAPAGSSTGNTITSIIWSTGQIPVGQREDFSFSAQVPSNATTIDWKAYQTYADGTVVHWDQKPTGDDDATGTAGPYSMTKVVDDLTSGNKASATASSNNTPTLVVAVAALVVALIALLRSAKRS